MRWTLSTLAVAVLLASSWAAAAEPKAAGEPQAPPPVGAKPATGPQVPTMKELCAHPPTPQLPQLQFQFMESKEPEPVTIRPEPVVQPDVMELRYVAMVVLGNPDVHANWGGSEEEIGLRPSRSILHLSQEVTTMSREATTKAFADLLRQEVPREALPAPENLKFLERGIPFFSWHGQPAFPIDNHRTADVILFSVAAPTVDQVKQRAEAVARLLARRIFYRNQQAAIEELRGRCKSFDEMNEKIATVEKSLEELSKAPKEGAELLDAETLRTLRMQQRLILVDIAGATARLETCKKLLAQDKENSARSSQVESLKVAAEIELVGLMARKQAVDDLVRKAEKQEELLAKWNERQSSLATLKRHREEMENGARRSWLIVQANRPQVLGPVEIHPIQWKVGVSDGPSK